MGKEGPPGNSRHKMRTTVKEETAGGDTQSHLQWRVSGVKERSRSCLHKEHQLRPVLALVQ